MGAGNLRRIVSIYKKFLVVQRRVIKMTFINEFVSDDDVKKFKLNEMWDRYHPYSKGDMNVGFRHSWTIDREKNIFFIPARSGREEHSNRKECILYWKGIELKVILIKHGLSPGPGVRWEVNSVQKPNVEVIPESEILSTLKAALGVYGYRGVWRQVDEYQVEFDF